MQERSWEQTLQRDIGVLETVPKFPVSSVQSLCDFSVLLVFVPSFKSHIPRRIVHCQGQFALNLFIIYHQSTHTGEYVKISCNGSTGACTSNRNLDIKENGL